MKRNFYINYFAHLFYQVFSVITPLITTPYVARVLQADGVGAYSYTYSIASAFVTIAHFGTGAYGQREIAYQQENVFERSRIFYNMVLFRFVAVGLSLSLYFPLFVRGEYAHIFLVQSLCIVASAFDITWFYHGIERFDLVATRDVLTKIVSISCVFMFVKTEGDVAMYTFVLAMAIIGGRIASWIPLRKYICKVPLKNINIFDGFKDVLILFLPTVASHLAHTIDKSMIGLITGSTFENGYYMQAERIYQLTIALATSITSVVYPRAAAMFAMKREDEMVKLAKKSSRFLWMLCLPAGVGLALVIDMIVPWFLGEGYDKVITLVQLLCINFIVVSVNGNVGSIFLSAKRRQKEAVTGSLINTGVNLVVNCILIPLFQSEGAVVATIISSITGGMITRYYVGKEFTLTDVLKCGKYYILPTAAMAAVVLFVKQYMENTIMDTILTVCCGVGTYGLLLLIMRDELLFGTLHTILKKLKIVT